MRSARSNRTCAVPRTAANRQTGWPISDQPRPAPHSRINPATTNKRTSEQANERLIARRAKIRLRKNLVDDATVHVGQPEIAAGMSIRQPGVIETQQMQHGGVQIVYMHSTFDGLV